jgi:myo-inositol catabolism protein IolH
MGNQPEAILEAAAGRVGIVHISDTMDHTASHGLRYITNPPGNAVRVHQHLRVGAGDVDFGRLFSALKSNGFLDNPNSVICSSVFAENDTNHDTAIYQLEAIKKLIANAS